MVRHRFKAILASTFTTMSCANGKYTEIAAKGAQAVGGGAINEKTRNYGLENVNQENAMNLNEKRKQYSAGKTNFDPKGKPSHLLHAIHGLDRYPHYLSRWNYEIDDIDRLESALEEQLQRVKEQKQRLLERNEAIDSILSKQKSSSDNILEPPTNWEEVKNDILHPKAAEAIFGSKLFRSKSKIPPSIHDVLNGDISIDLDTHLLTDWLEEEFFDVYSFPILRKEFCEKLKKQSKDLVASCAEVQSLRDFGTRPIDIDSIGVSWLNNILFHLIIRPLSSQLFGSTEDFQDLDWRQGYIAGYSEKPAIEKGAQRHRLVPHTDDSEVTLNIGMGDEDFEGGDLAFYNLRGTPEEGKFVGEFHPIMGHALIHSGRHLHEVQEVTKGDRYAYIIWARSWGSSRANICPCCWMTRRQNTSASKHRCICAPQWN